MKRSRFLEILSLGAVAAPVAGSAVVKALGAIAKPHPLDQGVYQGILNQINNNPQPSYTVLVGENGMKAFEEAMKKMSLFAEEQE